MGLRRLIAKNSVTISGRQVQDRQPGEQGMGNRTVQQDRAEGHANGYSQAETLLLDLCGATYVAACDHRPFLAALRVARWCL